MGVLIRHRVIVAVGAFIAFVLMGWSWAYASAPGSAAGDRETLAAVWCAWGQSESCVIPTGSGEVFVPRWVAESGCFSSDMNASAQCTYLLTAELTSIQLTPQMENANGFHTAMRALVGPDPARSIVLMRFLNVVIAGLLVALAAIVSRAPIRRALLLAWVAVVAPVGIFFIASTSPQSWVLVGVGTFWAFVTTVLQGAERRWQNWLAGLGALASGAMALTASPDSGALLALSVIVALLLSWTRLPDRAHAWARWVALAAASVGAFLLFSLTWASRVGFGADSTALVFPPGDVGRDQPNAVLKAVLEIPSFIAAMAGAQPPVWAQRMSPLDVGIPGYTWPGFTYGLGHTEHLLPSLVGVFLVAALGAVILTGFTRYSRRKVVAFVLVVAAFVATILFRRSLVAFEFLVDPLLPQEFWPFLLLAVGVALVIYPARFRLWIGPQIWLLVAMLAIAQSVALRGTLARYMYGQTHSYTNLGDMNRWWWPSGPEPNVVWWLGTLAGLALYALIVWGWSQARGAGPGSSHQEKKTTDPQIPSSSSKDLSAGTSSQRSLLSDV